MPARDSHPPPAWVTELFAFLARDAAPPTAFYHLPLDRVVELGIQVEI